MKKRIMALILLLLLLMDSCAMADSIWICEACQRKVPSVLGDVCPYCSEHHHQWTPATCTEPEICSCGKTRGEPLGHNWWDATCTKAKECAVCGITEGEANGHDWNDGTVVKAATGCEEGIRLYECRVCGETKEEVIPVDPDNYADILEKRQEKDPDTMAFSVRWNDAKSELEVYLNGEKLSGSFSDIRYQIIQNDEDQHEVKIIESDGRKTAYLSASYTVGSDKEMIYKDVPDILFDTVTINYFPGNQVFCNEYLDQDMIMVILKKNADDIKKTVLTTMIIDLSEALQNQFGSPCRIESEGELQDESYNPINSRGRKRLLSKTDFTVWYSNTDAAGYMNTVSIHYMHDDTTNEIWFIFFFPVD